MGFCCTVRVRYAETDQMGIVYHANYFTWFELARSEYMRALGQSYRQVEEFGIMLPVAEVGCRYLAPAHYDDLLEIAIRLTDLRAASICFDYQVTRPDDGTLIATGTTRQAIVDRSLRPQNCKRRWPEFWAMLRRELASN